MARRRRPMSPEAATTVTWWAAAPCNAACKAATSRACPSVPCRVSALPPCRHAVGATLHRESESPFTSQAQRVDCVHPPPAPLRAADDSNSQASSPLPRCPLLRARAGRETHAWASSSEGQSKLLLSLGRVFVIRGLHGLHRLVPRVRPFLHARRACTCAKAMRPCLIRSPNSQLGGGLGGIGPGVRNHDAAALGFLDVSHRSYVKPAPTSSRVPLMTRHRIARRRPAISEDLHGNNAGLGSDCLSWSERSGGVPVAGDCFRLGAAGCSQGDEGGAAE